MKIDYILAHHRIRVLDSKKKTGDKVSSRGPFLSYFGKLIHESNHERLWKLMLCGVQNVSEAKFCPQF